jgi:anti-sigma regulatory factor (Ser/Thr protein kinase)
MKGLKLQANLDALEEIQSYILAISQKVGLKQQAIYGLQLAVDELVTNIITHGYGANQPRGLVKVRAKLQHSNLLIFLEDTAKPYNPHEAVIPDLTVPVEQRPEGGLGIFLAKLNMDELIYKRVGNRNRNCLVMRLNSARQDSVVPQE